MPYIGRFWKFDLKLYEFFELQLHVNFASCTFFTHFTSVLTVLMKRRQSVKQWIVLTAYREELKKSVTFYRETTRGGS